MVLPSTGNTISFNDIRIELGVGSASPFDLAGAAADNFGQIQNCQSPYPTAADPDSINEWWSYNHLIRATQFLVGDDSNVNCATACAGTAPFNCFDSIYNYGAGYYSDDACRLPYSGFIVAPTNCSSGTKEGQTCYEISNGSLISQTTCTTATCECLGGYCTSQCPNPNNPCYTTADCTSA